jgi:hypothetical protein
MRKLSKRECVLLAGVTAVVFMAAAADNIADNNAVPAAEPAPPPKARTEPKEPANPTEVDVVQPRRVAATDEPANLFAGKSWFVPPPPPPPPKPAPPPPPMAPPLPFTYLGRYQDGDIPIIFLVRANRVMPVKVGDVIEGTYRVDGIVGATLGLTYIPLNIKQSLDIGGAG